ncbi:MAG: D-alanine--D-alanine ligase family protein [Trueperaceae bacterium]
MTPPRTVLLLCGGRSGEHEVSLASAASVLAAAPTHLAMEPRVIARDGRLLSTTASRAALDEGRSDLPQHDVDADPDLLRGLARLDLRRYDAVFPLLHGPNGEDGSVQGLLRSLDLPFVGSDVLGSAAAMDKIVMKRLFDSAGLPQTPWRGVDRDAWHDDPDAVRRTLAELAWPRFVKPANLGSSVGIGRAPDEKRQDEALREAFRFDRRVVVEASAEDAREIEVGVLGRHRPEASPPGEIVVPPGAYYDYAHKYTEGASELRIPADLPDDVADHLRALAIDAFRLVDAEGLARVDFFVTPGGAVLVNEINTLPGFTRTSMYPRLWQAAGVAYPDLIARLVELALERRNDTAAVR